MIEEAVSWWNLAEEPDRVGLLEDPAAVARSDPVLVSMSSM